MSDEFSDDFVVEEEEESSRPFLIAAGSLILIFIIISGVLLAFILTRQRDQSDEISAREATNEAIIASNAVIQQTADAIAAGDLASDDEGIGDAGDSEEPVEALPSATPELVPTRDVGSAVVATETPVAGSADGAGNGSADGSGNGDVDGAEDGAGDGTGDGSGGAAADGTDDGTTAVAGDGTGTEAEDPLATPTLAVTVPDASELPQTGIGVWGIAVAVLGMFGLLIVARRLRTA